MSTTQSIPPRLPTWLRSALYGTWFSACFAVFLYGHLSSSLQSLRGPLAAAMEDALGKGKQGRYGTDPVVQIGRISLWRLSGVELERVSVQLASTDPDPGPTLEFDTLQVRVGLFSLLLNEPTLTFGATLYGGEASGDVALRGAKGFEEQLFGQVRALAAGKVDGFRTLDLELDDIDLSRALFVQQLARVPAAGRIEGSIALDLGDNPDKEAEGRIDLALRGAELGPGELAIPLPGLTGGLTVPQVQLGDFVWKLSVAEGKGQSETLALQGKDVQADLSLALDVAPKFMQSRASGSGWFRIAPAFLEENGKFKTLLDFASPLKSALDDEGRYQFHWKGTLQRPGFKLGADNTRAAAGAPGGKGSPASASPRKKTRPPRK